MDATPRSVVERLNIALNAHDLPSARAMYVEDATLVMATGRRIGLDGLDELTALTLAAFPDMHIRVRRWVVDGNTVATEEVLEGTHQGDFAGLAPTGRRVRLPLCHVTTVKGSRIVERVAYHDTAGILRQLGDRSG